MPRRRCGRRRRTARRTAARRRRRRSTTAAGAGQAQSQPGRPRPARHPERASSQAEELANEQKDIASEVAQLGPGDAGSARQGADARRPQGRDGQEGRRPPERSRGAGQRRAPRQQGRVAQAGRSGRIDPRQARAREDSLLAQPARQDRRATTRRRWKTTSPSNLDALQRKIGEAEVGAGTADEERRARPRRRQGGRSRARPAVARRAHASAVSSRRGTATAAAERPAVGSRVNRVSKASRVSKANRVSKASRVSKARASKDSRVSKARDNRVSKGNRVSRATGPRTSRARDSRVRADSRRATARLEAAAISRKHFNGAYAGGPRNRRGTDTATSGVQPFDARQFARQFREWQGDAQQLRRELQNAGVNPKDLDDVIAQLQQLGNEGAYGNPEGIEKLQQAALEKLQTFEFNLRKKAEPNQDSLALSGSDEVPAGFRDQIAEYYRQLAEEQEVNARVAESQQSLQIECLCELPRLCVDRRHSRGSMSTSSPSTGSRRPSTCQRTCPCSGSSATSSASRARSSAAASASAARARCTCAARRCARARRRFRPSATRADHDARRPVGRRIASACRWRGRTSTCRSAATARPDRSCRPRRCSRRSRSRPTPTSTQAMNGNICRCGTYLRIREAIHKRRDRCGTRAARTRLRRRANEGGAR